MKGSLVGICVNSRGKRWNVVRSVWLLFVYVFDLWCVVKELVGSVSVRERSEVNMCKMNWQSMGVRVRWCSKSMWWVCFSNPLFFCYRTTQSWKPCTGFENLQWQPITNKNFPNITSIITSHQTHITLSLSAKMSFKPHGMVLYNFWIIYCKSTHVLSKHNVMMWFKRLFK